MWCRRRADRPATPTEPPQWQLHPPSEMVAISRWPKVPKFASAGPAALPVPALSASRLAHDRSRRARRAAWTRRPLAARCPVATANDVTAGRHAGRAAGSSGEPFQNSGIGAPDPAGLVPAPGGDCASPFNGSLLRKARRQISPPRPHGRGPAAGACRTCRADAAAKRWRRPPPSRRRKPNGMGDRFGSPG